jgi:thioredoxin reductase
MQQYDVIIVGGSIAGLSAAMTLGRSLRKVLVIDSCNPCNIQTPQSHNFITNDGKRPKHINQAAREEVLRYPTVTFLDGLVTDIVPSGDAFTVKTRDDAFLGGRILLATGLRDLIPDVPGFAECWGISVLHCPYCHGYEVKGLPTAVLANGQAAYHLGTMVAHWASTVTILTNGTSELRNEEAENLSTLGVTVLENEISDIIHKDGRVGKIRFADGTYFPVSVVYASVPFEQQSDLAEKLGCKMLAHGHIDIDPEQRTSVKNVYAAGDNTAQQRALSVASASGTRAGFTINAEMVLEKSPF